MAITSIKTGSSFTNLVKYDSFLGPNSAFIPTYPSFESIQTATATGGETSLSFTSIPSTYKSLQIRGIYNDTYASGGPSFGYMQGRLNNDSGSNYAFHRLYGNGVSATASGYTSQTYFAAGIGLDAGTLANDFGANILDIIDYADTSKYKTIRLFAGVDSNGASNGQLVGMFSSLWRSTAAITSITLNAFDNGFTAGSTFALYGIKG
jgi:hypothetical protein